jgi:Spy/CpxP family protein refolding chaperone
MKTRLVPALGVVLIALALGAPTAARAQGQPPLARPELERRVRARFAETVREELGISAEQLERVQRVEASFLEARQQLRRREMTLRRRMLAGADTSRTEAEARARLDELAALRDEEARLFRTEMDAMLEVLTPPQALRFYELREQLMERVRRLRGLGPGRGGPPGPRGGPPGPRGGLPGGGRGGVGLPEPG